MADSDCNIVWEQEVSRGSFSDGMLYNMLLER